MDFDLLFTAKINKIKCHKWYKVFIVLLYIDLKHEYYIGFNFLRE